MFVSAGAEKPEGAGEDEEVLTARGAGVPHGSAGHADAARGAGEKLPARRGRLQESHRKASIAGLILLGQSPVCTEGLVAAALALQPT